MYEANEAPFPFWGSETKTKGGRDPLAVQNSSVVIYSNLITGITNVTGRIRYVSHRSTPSAKHLHYRDAIVFRSSQ